MMNHSLCDGCWEKREGARTPIKMKEPSEEVCCGCGKLHKSGIFVRGVTKDFICGGLHK